MKIASISMMTTLQREIYRLVVGRARQTSRTHHPITVWGPAHLRRLALQGLLVVQELKGTTTKKSTHFAWVIDMKFIIQSLQGKLKSEPPQLMKLQSPEKIE